MAAEAHMKHIQYREESRYPGFCYRMDFSKVDGENWKRFVNSSYDKKTKTWTLFKRKHLGLVDQAPGPLSFGSAGIPPAQAPRPEGARMARKRSGVASTARPGPAFPHFEERA